MTAHAHQSPSPDFFTAYKTLVEKTASANNLQEVMEAMIDALLNILPKANCAFLIPQPDAELSIIYCTSHNAQSPVIFNHILEEMRKALSQYGAFKNQSSIALEKALQGKVMLEVIRQGATFDETSLENISSICIPIESQDQLRGLFYIDVMQDERLHKIQGQIEELLAVTASSFQVIEDRIKQRVQSIKQYRQALDAASDGVAFLTPEGKVEYWNPSLLSLTGYSDWEVEGGDFCQLFLHEKTNDQLLESIKNAIKNGEHFISDDVILQLRNNNSLELNLSVSPVIDDGRICFFIALLRDIHAQKVVQEFQQHFDTFISHQISTPLSSIITECSMLLDEMGGELSQTQKEIVQSIKKQTSEALDLARYFLTILRLEKGQIHIDTQPEDPAQLIEDALELIQPKCQSNQCTIEVIKPNALSPVMVEGSMVRQVITNLITNAIKYSPKDRSHIKIELSEKDSHCEIRVTDNGIGIPQDAQKHIFSKLYRAENAKQNNRLGMGLGLYFVKLLVEALGGFVGFTSNPALEDKQGETTFWIKLPICKEDKNVE